MSLISVLAGAQLTQWPATIIDATIRDCDDGAIDLHPQSPQLTYHYAWYNRSSSVPFAYSEDVSGLAPGIYTVVIEGPLCNDYSFTYVVWLKDYDFEVLKSNPTDCDPSKIAVENGGVKISWNRSVQPQPTVTWMNDRHTGTPVINDSWIGPMNPGTHEFRFAVGDCMWSHFVELCCCSVEEDYQLNPDDPNLCTGLADGVSFSIELLGIVGATDWHTPDGRLSVRINSPGPNPRILWTGPRRNGTNYTSFGEQLTGLYPGEYCYSYTDDCQLTPISACFTVDNCDTGGDVIQSYDVVRVCQDENDGSMGVYVNIRGDRTYEVHTIELNGSTGPIATNATIDLDRSSGWNFHFTDLAPGDHTYRIISNQHCKYDITFTLPQRIARKEIDAESCSQVIYCDERIMEREYVEQELIDSEVCYIDRYRCPLTSEITPVNHFDHLLVYELSYSIEEGTCRFLYACTTDSPQYVEGTLSWKIESTYCPPLIESEQRPEATFGLICQTANYEGFVNELEIQHHSTVVATRIEFLGCECSPNSRHAEWTYSAASPSGDVVNFDCCRYNACPVFNDDLTNSATERSFDVETIPITCLAEADHQTEFRLVEVATGRVIHYSASRKIQIIESLQDGASPLTATRELRLSSGVYAIEFRECGTIKFIKP